MARSGVIYGGTGTRKTTQIKRLAHYIAKKTGKVTLLLSTDGGGWAPCQPEIDAGMIRPYRCETATLPLVLLRKISQGYWPVNTEETNPEKIDLVPINYDEVGGMGVEGWSSISQVVMRYLPDKGISVGGEDRNKVNSNMAFSQAVQVMGQWEAMSFGSSTRGDYGFLLNYLYGLVMNFNSLPLEYVLHTALEGKTEDDDRSTINGPLIAGKKGTSQCGAWVGDMIHAQDYPVVKKILVPDPQDATKKIEQDMIEMTVRDYFKKHLDPTTGIPFPAKARVTPEQIGALDKRFPGGYFEPTADGKDGFDEYLQTVDELSTGQTDSLKGWRDRLDQKLGRAAKV
jgi:hypothetical protein